MLHPSLTMTKQPKTTLRQIFVKAREALSDPRWWKEDRPCGPRRNPGLSEQVQQKLDLEDHVAGKMCIADACFAVAWNCHPQLAARISLREGRPLGLEATPQPWDLSQISEEQVANIFDTVQSNRWVIQGVTDHFIEVMGLDEGLSKKRRALGLELIFKFNNTHTHEEILAALDKCIEALPINEVEEPALAA